MRGWMLGGLCLVATACVSTKVQLVDQSVRPARSPDAVGALQQAPQQPYTVIAEIESRGESVFDSFGDLRNALIAKAAELGGDAVILGPQKTDEQFIFNGTTLVKSERRRLSGKVIVFSETG